MTDAAIAPESRIRALPRSWWARGLTLRERLAAPATPAPVRAAAPHGGTAPWSAGDEAGFAARLASLGIDGDTAHALVDETAERLSGRAAKPDWADYIERAVALAPERPGEPAGAASGAGGPAVFLPAFYPLIAPAWAEVCSRTSLPAGEQAVVRAAFEGRLGDLLTRQAARTLVRELNLARTAGRLPGDTSRDRFLAYTGRLGTREGLAELFTGYPVLARMLGQSCVQAAGTMVELLTRFTADRAAVVADLLPGAAAGTLTGLDLDRGDAHRGGRSVALLRFAGGGTVVYKPRPLDQHALLDEAARWLNGKVPGLLLRTPRSVRRPGYGWLEFIEHRGCGSVAEVDLFYRRQGALLALLYAMDGADMHYENVIACGDQPVLVDAETLLHSGLPSATTAGSDPAEEALGASVHRTCLLPHLLIGENGALDISALGGSAGGLFPSDGVRWQAAGTDEMRLVRAPVESRPAQNRPLLHGSAAGHADHRAALLEGFRAGYDAITGNRRELLGDDGLLARWATSPGRLLARATRLYTALLEESTHPAVLRDALARESVFAVLWTESAHDAARQRLIEDETADLWSGDVPLFFHHPASTAVWGSRDTRLEGVLPAPSLRIAHDKILAMGEVDRHDQEWIISATLAVTQANQGAGGPRSALVPPPAPTAVPDPARLLAAACGIADEISARAVHGGGRVNWLGLEQVAGTHWAVLPMGGGLAQGYCGVALFLAQIGALTGADRYTALAREAVRPLPALLSAMVEEPELSAAAGPGVLHGAGGIVYALARLSALLGDGVGDCLPEALAALELAAAPDAGASGPTDLAEGLAGALAATLAVRRPTGTAGAADLAAALASEFADRLLVRTAHRTTEPGFATGGAGIGWALLRYAATRPDAARPHAAAGAALLRSALTTALERPGDLGWESGLSGTALAAADALGGPGGLGDPVPDASLDRCVRLLDTAAPPADLSLRHGALGTAEALAALSARGHEGARTALAHRTGEVLGRMEQYGHLCGTPDHVPSPGLLTGLSGIGYALLRLGFPDAVPSVLLLGHASGASSSRRTA